MVLVVDTVIIGWLREERYLAAAAIGGLLMFWLNSPFIALSVATHSIVSRSLGQRDTQTAGTFAMLGLVASVLLAAMLWVVFWPIAQDVARLFGAAADVSGIAGRYLAILMISGLCGFPMAVVNAIIRAGGNAKTPMWLVGLTNIVNIAASIVLAFGVLRLPGWGVYGVAWGTVVARTVGFVVGTWYLIYPMKLSPRLLRLTRWKDCHRLWHLAWPTCLERLLGSSIYILFMRLVAQLGTTALAAHQVALQVESVAFMPAWALGVVASTLVGQAVGADLPHIAQEVVRRLALLALLMMGMMAAIFLLFGPAIVKLFGGTQAVVAAAGVAIRIASVELVFMAWTFIFVGAFRAAGDPRWPMMISFISAAIFRLFGTWLLAHLFDWGLVGVWTATTLDWFGRSASLAVAFISGGWRRMHQQEQRRFTSH